MPKYCSLIGVALLGLSQGGCGSFSEDPTAARWLLDVNEPLPEHLSEVGVYKDVVARTAYTDVVAYEPRHPLYSNGLEKERLAYLPEGTAVEIDGVEPWGFPVGTVLAKTFIHEGTPVETRFIFRTGDGWDYGIYHWLPDASDAEVLSDNWAEVSVVLGDEEVPHTLPSRLDCRTCHETHESVSGSPVLGISSLQTATDLIAAGVFSEPPPTTVVQGRSDEETAALSYFVGNCISCHNGGDSINTAFSLYPNDAVATTVNRPTESETAAGIRVVPGYPEESVLYITVAEAGRSEYRGPFKVMPPIGVDVTDPEASGVLRAWIESL